MQKMPWILALALAMPIVPTAWATPATHEFTLDNGLKLLVREDHRAPVVVSQVWYKVGASYEHDGVTGLSHVLEHMMFQGTEKLEPNEFSRIIAENGGRENAFTGRDYTAYFQTLGRDRLPVSFELEADRMRNLKLREAEFNKEVKVVMEERRMRTEDNPQSLTYEQFLATAFLASPNRIPVIGWMNDLEHMQLPDLQRWYEAWYAPNNATLMVVGDVDPQDVLKLAKQHFGPLKPAEQPAQKPRIEPQQRGERRITVKAPAQLPYLLMGYKVPTLVTAETEWEPYALEVLAGILDGGSSARLSKQLVRGSRIAASAGAGYDLTTRNGGLFMLDATPSPEQPVAKVEAALREQIARLREAPVEAAELERIKAQVVAGAVYERDSMFYQGMQLATLETVGLDWRIADQYVDRVRAVTPEQLQQVAKKYLIDDHLTVAVLDPQPIDPSKVRPMSSEGMGHVR